MSSADERWWIPAPVEHRRHARTSRSESNWLAEMMDVDVESISVVETMLPDDLWVCDICNGDIALRSDDGKSLWVPMLLSYALCGVCLIAEVKKTPELLAAVQADPDVSIDKSWSPNVCACDACVEHVKKLMAAGLN